MVILDTNEKKKHFYPQGTLKKNLNGNLIAFASQVGSCENSVLSVTRITMVQRRNHNRIKTETQPIKNVSQTNTIYQIPFSLKQIRVEVTERPQVKKSIISVAHFNTK